MVEDLLERWAGAPAVRSRHVRSAHVDAQTLWDTAATIRLVADVLAGGDFYGDGDGGVGPIKAFAWPMLVQAAGLAELRGTRLALTKAGVKALGADPVSVIRTAWDRWLGTRILDELARIADQPLEADEFARVRRQLLSASAFMTDTITWRAYRLGEVLATGAATSLAEWYDRLAAVAAEDIRAAAESIFKERSRVVGWFIPEEPA